jgi:hypothetical protein
LGGVVGVRLVVGFDVADTEGRFAVGIREGHPAAR